MTNGSDYQGTATIPLKRLKELEEIEDKFIENLKPLDELTAKLVSENETLKRDLHKCKAEYRQLSYAYSACRDRIGHEEASAAQKMINQLELYCKEQNIRSSLDAVLDEIEVGFFFAHHLSEEQKDSIKKVFSNKLLGIINILSSHI